MLLKIEMRDKRKKNIVVIFLELIENAFKDESIWGENLIPNVSKVEEDSISVKGYHDLGITRSTIKS